MRRAAPECWRAALIWLAVLAGALAGGLGLAASAAARANWGKPFELTKPGSLDYLGPQLAFSPQGAVAAAYSIANVDVPGSSRASLVTRTGSGRVGRPRAIDGAGQVLSLAYDGRPLELLVGSSPHDQDCCSAVQAIRVSASGSFGSPRALVTGLTGATQGQLLTLADGQMMAAVATERGVGVTQSSRGDRFGPSRVISDRGQEPVAMSAAWLGQESTIVAWTAGTGVIGASTPRAIDYATGSRRQAPHRARVAVTVPAGHRIDELAVVRSATGATLAWIESWYDKQGSYHSRVEAADVAKGAGIRTISPANRLASGLAAGNDSAGDQALTWESCTSGAACTVQAAGRPANGTFGPARTLGVIDAYQSPSIALSPQGRVVVAWVRGGHPVASVGFRSPAVLSASSFATDPAVAFGPRSVAVVAWTQGTLNPSVVAAAYR